MTLMLCESVCLTASRCPVPDGVGQVVPAEVDGSGAVLDGVVQGHRAGLGQVAAGVRRVPVH